MRVSLPVCLAAFAAGIVLSNYLLIERYVIGLCLGGSALFFCLFLCAPHRYLRLRLWGVLFAVVCAGGGYALWIQQPPADLSLLTRWQNKKVHWSGSIHRITTKPQGRWQADLKGVQLCSAGRCIALPGDLRLYGKPPMPALRPWDGLSGRGRIRRPRNFGIPGEFNYARYLQTKGVAATTFVAKPEKLRRAPRLCRGLLQRIDRWRFALAEAIRHNLPPQQSGLVRALVVGDGAGILPEQRRILSRAGLSHLFAISGLHLGLIGWILYRLLSWVYQRSACCMLWQPSQRIVPLLLIPPLTFYMLLAGAGIATQRALTVAAVVALLGGWGRISHPLRILAAMALALLLLNPLHLFTASFQLSFAGAASILLVWPRWRPFCERLPPSFRPVISLLVVSVAASLGTMAFAGFHFHGLAWVGPLMNVWAVPLVGFAVVPAGLIAAALYPLWPALAIALWRCAGWFVVQALDVADRCVLALPATAIDWYGPPVVFFLSGTLIFALLAGGFRWKRLLLLINTAALALFLLLEPTPQTPLRLEALSVGQGDAYLLTRSGGERWLIDGGGLYSQTFDVGERLLLPAFGALGVKAIDCMVLTHRHPDHWKGLVTVVRRWSVGQFFATIDRHQLPQPLRVSLEQAKIQVVQPPAGIWWCHHSDRQSEVYFWWTPASNDENDRSLVVYVRHGRDGVLLTGDLEEKGVNALLRAGVPGPVTLLKLPHHGSRHSDTRRLIRSLHPAVVVVSSGYGNHYRLPAASLTDWIAGKKIRLYRTDRQGTVRLDLIGGRWQASRWQQGLFR